MRRTLICSFGIELSHCLQAQERLLFAHLRRLTDVSNRREGDIADRGGGCRKRRRSKDRPRKRKSLAARSGGASCSSNSQSPPGSIRMNVRHFLKLPPSRFAGGLHPPTAARDLAVRPWRSLSHSKVMLVTAGGSCAPVLQRDYGGQQGSGVNQVVRCEGRS